MLSLSKHLAEALLGKRHYLTLAERNLNNKYNLAAGKKKNRGEEEKNKNPRKR